MTSDQLNKLADLISDKIITYLDHQFNIEPVKEIGPQEFFHHSLDTFGNIKNIDKKRIENYWSSLGTVHWLKTESKIDKFTALIGSGPAYLIYFCECLVMVFKNFGLNWSPLPIFIGLRV